MELSFTARNVLAGATLLGATGGVVGCFALLRRQSLLGDALAHAALPGVCVAYLATRAKSPAPLFAGALLAGLLGSLLILAVVRWSRIKEDSAIGIVLSVFFGVGIVLLTHIQKLPFGNQSGLDKFLFGQAATLVPRDLAVMAALAALALAGVALFYKELKLLAFDREFGRSLGFPMRRLEVLLTFLLVLVVVVGLQTVGVVLMVATLITPAAAARQWTERLGTMILIAATIGGGAGAVGALASASVERLPTGPAIVLASSAVLVVSLAAAPRRGLLWAYLDTRRVARRIRQENLLKDLYLWGERHGGEFGSAVPWPELEGMRGQSARSLAALCRPLAGRGRLAVGGAGAQLTAAGLAAAEALVRRHRLWEVYLTRRLELPSDHVHRDADVMEHALSDDDVARLEDSLGRPAADPHGRPIPPRRAA
jgi:manganese/zinc/iron transport system permease protein